MMRNCRHPKRSNLYMVHPLIFDPEVSPFQDYLLTTIYHELGLIVRHLLGNLKYLPEHLAIVYGIKLP